MDSIELREAKVLLETAAFVMEAGAGKPEGSCEDRALRSVARLIRSSLGEDDYEREVFRLLDKVIGEEDSETVARAKAKADDASGDKWTLRDVAFYDDGKDLVSKALGIIVEAYTGERVGISAEKLYEYLRQSDYWGATFSGRSKDEMEMAFLHSLRSEREYTHVVFKENVATGETDTFIWLCNNVYKLWVGMSGKNRTREQIIERMNEALRTFQKHPLVERMARFIQDDGESGCGEDCR